MQSKLFLSSFQHDYAQDVHTKVASKIFKLQIDVLLDTMADKITAKDLAEKKADFVLIDVRETDEIDEDGGGTIEGAVNIPLGQLIRKGRQGELDDLKGKTICTYCNGGYRGNIGADELNKKGFRAVTIDGGYAAWKEEKKNKK
jgi:rhodanese-related sulfurtransferase